MSRAASLQTQSARRPSPMNDFSHANWLQRKCFCGNKANSTDGLEECQGKKLQRKASDMHQVEQIPASVDRVLRSPGRPLEKNTRDSFEQKFGQDFSQVRIHDDAQASASACEINALAYTAGSHVAFCSGAYAPNTIGGKGLLAHELTHVIQQCRAPLTLSSLTLDQPGEGTQEREAESARHAIESNRPVGHITALPALAVQRLPGSPAGGCGVCYGGPKNAGIAAHSLIQDAFNPLVNAEFPLLPSPDDENGRLDLVRFTGPGSVQIGEIKPANPNGLLQGDLDLFWYEDQLTKLGFKVSRMVLPPPVPALDFPSLAPPPCPSTQRLFVDPPVHGIYTYWCMPDFSQLIGQCPCIRDPSVPVTEKGKEKKRSDEKEKESAKSLADNPLPAPARSGLKELLLNFGVPAALISAVIAMAVVAAVDPEPVSKLAAGLAALLGVSAIAATALAGIIIERIRRNPGPQA